MRHQRLKRKLGVKSQHRKALLRNLVRELVAHKRIRTTHAKAKEASAFAEKMVTLAKRGDLHARRLLVSKLGHDDTAKKLINDVAPLFKERQGGYTRVLRLEKRPGDATDMALLEFTVLPEIPKKTTNTKKSKKKAKDSAEESVEKPSSKAKPTKEKTKGKAPEAKETPQDEKSESEKKGGFLGTLRKFLKGD